MRKYASDEWLESREIQYHAIFQEPKTGELLGYLGHEPSNKSMLHFRTLNEEGKFWCQEREEFLFFARRDGYTIVEIESEEEGNVSFILFVLLSSFHFLHEY